MSLVNQDSLVGWLVLSWLVGRTGGVVPTRLGRSLVVGRVRIVYLQAVSLWVQATPVPTSLGTLTSPSASTLAWSKLAYYLRT